MKTFTAALLAFLALAGGAMAQSGGVPISQLPAATTPLTGAEIVPLVQSGATKRATVSQIGTLAGPFPSVLAYGAKCDGVTDDTTAINNALAANLAVLVPPSTCYSASGITLPYGHRITGATFSAAPDVDAVGSEILCPNSISVCLHVGNGSANDPSIVDHLTVVGSGTPASGADGILIDGGYNVILEDVAVSNFDHLYHWKAYPATFPGISGIMDHAFGSKSQTAYVWIDSWPELHISNSRMGSADTGDYSGGEYLLISGGFGGSSGGPNTLTVENTQFNQGTSGPAWGIRLANLTSPGLPSVDATFWKFTDVHWEHMSSGWITSDASWNYMDRWMFEQNSVNIPALPCLSLSTSTQLTESSFVGNQLFCSTFTLNPSAAANNMSWVSFIANDFTGVFSLTANMTGSTVSFYGNQFRAASTFAGAYGALTLAGDQYFTTPPTFNATGTVSILEPQYPSSALYGCLACANIWTMAQTVGTNTTTEPLILNGPAGVSRYVTPETAGLQRWAFGASGSTESGGNAGSDFFVDRYNDAGTKVDTPFEILRLTGEGLFPDGMGSPTVTAQTGLNMGNSPTNVGTLLCSSVAPTVTSAGTSPSIVDNNGTCSFAVNVGTGGTASAVVLALPAATTGWSCEASDVTTQSTSVFVQKQTASSTAAATLTNYNTAGSATPFVASDKLRVACHAD